MDAGAISELGLEGHVTGDLLGLLSGIPATPPSFSYIYTVSRELLSLVLFSAQQDFIYAAFVEPAMKTRVGSVKF